MTTLLPLIVLDDASDPTVAARNARKLVTEDKVDVLIGTSGVPGSLAMSTVARELQNATAEATLPLAERCSG